jgi:hypothetical protein
MTTWNSSLQSVARIRKYGYCLYSRSFASIRGCFVFAALGAMGSIAGSLGCSFAMSAPIPHTPCEFASYGRDLEDAFACTTSVSRATPRVFNPQQFSKPHFVSFDGRPEKGLSVIKLAPVLMNPLGFFPDFT